MKHIYIKIHKSEKGETEEAYTRLTDLLRSENLESNYDWFWNQLRNTTNKTPRVEYPGGLTIKKIIIHYGKRKIKS